MVNDAIIGYAETLMNTQWTYFFDVGSKSWVDLSGTADAVNAPYFLGWGGAGFAFILSLLGAIENAGKTIYYVEWGMDTWLSTFGEGTFEDILADAAESKSMQSFLVIFTVDLIAYSLTMFWHSLYIIGVGYAMAMLIFTKFSSYNETYIVGGANSSTIPIVKGYKAMLFGVLVGTINYFSGNVTKNSMDSVMLSMGFMEHSYEEGESITTVVTSNTGVSTTTSTGADEVDVVYDYKKLLEMQDNW